MRADELNSILVDLGQMTRPSCEMDARIANVLGYELPAPAFTSTVDAARLLVPPKMGWSVGETYCMSRHWGHAFVHPSDAVCLRHKGEYQTTAIALCDAAVQAILWLNEARWSAEDHAKAAEAAVAMAT